MVEPPGPRVTNARVVSSALWSALATGISAPVLIVTTVLVARILGVGDYGRFAFYSYLVALVVGIGDLGVGAALLRGGAVAAGTGDQRELMRFVRAGTTWSLLQIPWAVAVGWLVLPTDSARVVYAIAAVLSLGFLGPSHYLVMTSTLRWASQVRLASLVLSTAGLIGAAAATHNPSLTFAAGALGANALTVVQIFALPREHRFASLLPGRLVLTRADFGFGLGLLLNSQLSGFVFSRSEVLFFRKDQANARGVFASAQTIAARSTLLIDVFFGTTTTGFASARGRGGETLRRSFTRVSEAAALLFAMTSPLIAVIVVTLGPVVFGDGFDGIAGPALVLTLCSLFGSSMTPIFALRFAQRSIVPVIAAGLLSAGIDAGLAAWLVPRWGVWGAVTANVTAGVVYLVAAAASYLRDPEWRVPVAAHVGRVMAPLVMAAAAAAPLLALSTPVGLAVGIPVALVVSAALPRLPGARISDDGARALIDAMPARLRRPVEATVTRLTGKPTHA